MRDTYSLGSSEDEQSRLVMQRELYGDTRDIRFQESDRVCEFGCGVGANLWIARAVPRGRYVGVDNQPAQIRRARQRAAALKLEHVEFRVQDAAHTDLEKDSFDVSFCRCLLIHLPDPVPLLDEMFRVTRPGGRVVVIEPHDITYYAGPDMPHLMKCFRARIEHAYGGGRGSPDVAVNLYPLLRRYETERLSVRPHVITVLGTERDRFSRFLQNLRGLIEPVAGELAESGMVTEQDWERARREAQTFSDCSFLTQTLWIAEAQRPG